MERDRSPRPVRIEKHGEMFTHVKGRESIDSQEDGTCSRMPNILASLCLHQLRESHGGY